MNQPLYNRMPTNHSLISNIYKVINLAHNHSILVFTLQIHVLIKERYNRYSLCAHPAARFCIIMKVASTPTLSSIS